MGKISKYLKSLGNTGDEVAESLRKEGVKGYRKHILYCPLALAIRKKFPGTIGLRVDCNLITYNDPQTMDPQHTKATSEFVRNFDDHRYPDLELS